MKKSTLALSIAAALGGLGLAGTASAMTTLDTTGTATKLTLNPNGIGHQLVFPYFTAQGDNATLLSIVNTDTTNGKLVKVRFRGASNSDDLYDFQVLMSPADVWTAAVSKDATTGVAKLSTSDNTCTVPATINGNFSTNRVDPKPTKGDSANETREGYVEVINMADIPPTGAGSALYTAIKHDSKGVAACTATRLEASLFTDTDRAGYVARGLNNPTGGLFGDWIILNQANTAAWSGAATALQALDGSDANASGMMVVWPQKSGNLPASPAISAMTADPILTNSIVTAQFYDLPDMSTPYVTNDSSPLVRAAAATGQLAVKAFANQYVTSDDIAAVTDILFSQPTRRYHAAVNYTATSTADGNTGTTGTAAAAVYSSNTNGYYQPGNTDIVNRQLCVNDVSMPGASKANDLFNRSEVTPNETTVNEFVISPQVPAPGAKPFYFCGEASVLSINATSATDPSALGATVARSDVTYAATYDNGWMVFSFTGGTNSTGNGYPVLGQSFMRIANGTVNYGVSYSNKKIR